MKSLKLRLMAVFTLVIFLVAGILGFINIRIISNNLMEDAHRDLETMVVSEAKYIKTLVNSNLRYLEGLARNSMILDPDTSWSEKVSFFEEEAKRVGYEQFAIADNTGNARYFSNEAKKENISTEDYFQKALTGEANISDIMVDPTTGQLTVVYAVPIYVNETISGVFLAKKDGSTLCKIAESITYGATGECQIIDNKGTVVGHKSLELVLRQDNIIQNAKANEENNDLNGLIQKMLNREIGSGSYIDQGIDKIVAFAPVEGNHWIVIMGIQTTEVLTKVSALKSILITMIVGAVIFGAIVTFIASGAISRPIKKITRAAKQIASGDFNVALDVKSKDEVGQLAEAFNLTIARLVNYQGYIDEVSDTLLAIADGNLTTQLQREYVGQFEKVKINTEAMLENLNTTLSQINQAAEQVDSGSDQVSNGAQALSQGATEQASSIEEISSEIAALAIQIRQIAEKASLVSEQAQVSGRVLENSNEEMKQMIAAMDQISLSSSEIFKIIKLIDDIAFQTNILALNAAVEAARAGSAGKGFAVVADEVRNLAGKTTEAAKSTTVLIEESLEAVKRGTSIASTTAKSLQESALGAKDVISFVFEIADVSEHQALAIEQINLSIEQISAVVQTNAATAEESAAASEELSSQANLLRELVAEFELKDCDYQPDYQQSTKGHSKKDKGSQRQIKKEHKNSKY
ncbi:methyl-accepting chemotaxis protein [Anaerotignum sp.]|uniref:methyl-accepting chemotaxis protein n=1 Tax=Anaerotignum sp. TaxID=2039241 RepID=UPI00331DDC36